MLVLSGALKNKKRLLCLALTLSTALFALSLDLIHEFHIGSLLAALIFAVAAFFSGSGLQRDIHEDLYRSTIPLRDVIKVDLVRAAITLACMIGVCIVYGALAALLQVTLFPVIGFTASIAVLSVLALAISVVLLPLFAMSFFAPIRNTANHTRKHEFEDEAAPNPSPLAYIRDRICFATATIKDICAIEVADIKRTLAAYAPILIVSIICLIAGAASHALLALIPDRVVSLALTFSVATALGFVWMNCVVALCGDAVRFRSGFD